MQHTLFDIPARPTRLPAKVAPAPVDAAPLLMAPGQVVSRYRAELALMELYARPRQGRTAALAAELLELPAHHPAVRVCLDAAEDAARVLRVRGSVPFAEVQALARVVVAAGGAK